MGLGYAQFPGKSRVVDGAVGSCSRSAVIARDQDHLGPGLGNAGGYGAHAGFRHQLDRDPGVSVGVLQVIDQLGQVLYGINVVVGRRGDQLYAGSGASGLCYPGIDLLCGKVSPLPGLGALGHLDLDLLSA